MYNYDSMDRLVEINYSGTGKTISYTYDLAGNLITTTDWTGTTTYSCDVNCKGKLTHFFQFNFDPPI